MTAPEVLAAIEAAGGRAWLERGRVLLEPGEAAPALVAAARAAVHDLAAELKRRRLEVLVASCRRCSWASAGLEGTDETHAAGQHWCLAADDFGRGIAADDAPLLAAEAQVISAWADLRRGAA